jgi:hypothetical protein
MKQLLVIFLSLALVTGVGLPARSADDSAQKASGIKGLDRFIPGDFCGAVIVHPSRIMKSPLWAGFPSFREFSALGGDGEAEKQPDTLLEQQALKALDASKIRRAILLIDPFPGGNVMFLPAMILQFEDDADTTALSKVIKQDSTKLVKTPDGDYYRTKQPMMETPMAACEPVHGTFLIAPEPTLKKMLAPSKAPRPLADRLHAADLDNDVVVEYLAAPAVDAAARMLGKRREDLPSTKTDEPFKTLLLSVKSMSLALNLKRGPLVRAELVAVSEQEAARLHDMASPVLANLPKSFQSYKTEAAKRMQPELAEPLFATGDELLAGAELRKDGAKLTLTLKSPESLARLAAAAGKAVTQLVAAKGGKK